MGVKINLRIITKKHEADPGIGFLTKSISKPYGREPMPPAWELMPEAFKILEFITQSKCSIFSLKLKLE